MADPESKPKSKTNKKPYGRARTPTVLQMEEVECGAAALGSVLGYHGRIVPLEELRLECGVSRDGSKASNMLKAARKFGLTAKGEQRDLEALAALPRPVILFWNFNHFVVLEGYRRGKFYLNDPAAGPRTVTDEEFHSSYTGVVLSFWPGAEFTKGGSQRTLTAALLRRMAGSQTAFLFAALAGLALVIPGLVIPTFSRIFVDEVLVGGLRSWLRPLLLGMVITAVLRGFTSWLQEYYLLRLQTKLAVSTSGKFLWHILRLPVEFYAQRYGGEVSGRVAINDRVAEFLSAQLAARAIDAMMVVFFVALMFTYDPILPLIGIVAVTLLAVLTKFVNRKRVDGNRRLLAEEGKAMGALMGGLATIETLKASAGENDLFARWAGYQAKFNNSSQRLGKMTQLFLTTPSLLINLANAGVLALGAYRVMQGELTMGMLVAFQSLMYSFTTPVQNLVNLAGNLQEMEGNMNRLDDVLRYRTDPRTVPREESEEQIRGKLSGRVELASLTFGYSRLSKPLLENFSVTLEPGTRVALVGPSGSGKSTVAKLVTGLYAPWEGQVLFDGQPLDAVPRSMFTNSIGIVDQEIALFGGSIRENLTLWDSTVPDQVVIDACKDAAIHEDITSREGGYESRVEEGGTNFSGGQRQRLEIARALVGKPRVLVLDEATSALDTVTEQIIDRNLRRRGCTCIVVAHRLSTIRDADEILVLERGKVVQRGTHEQLVAEAGGLYGRLVQQI